MKKVLILLLCALLAMSMLSACSKTSEGKQSSSASTELPTKDRSGNAIEVPAEVKTIVSLAPSTTEFLLDLGLSDKIVGTDSYSQMSYGADLKSDVAVFDMMAPDNEAIAALSPDIVFTTGMSMAGGEDVFASLREAGVCVADIPSSTSIAEIAEDLRFLGVCVGKAEETETIVKAMNDTVESIRKQAQDIKEKKTVLYEMSTPTADYPTIYSAGKGTYIDELLAAAGLVSVTADQESWVALGEESAIEMDPELIFTTDTYTPDVVNVLLGLEGWENVKAVQNKAIYLLENSDALNRPNQHVVSALVEMARLAYPDVFGDLEDPFAAEEQAAA